MIRERNQIADSINAESPLTGLKGITLTSSLLLDEG
jgi:hypothetical protein